jgi:hypothetical protein
LRINESHKLTAFNNLLLGKDIVSFQKEDLNESDEIYLGLVNGIHSNDQAAFENYYNKKNKSHPSKESPSPFVSDDFLIFCLIVGITKFRLNNSWIKTIVSIRSRNAITITLENILNENYYSKSNLYEIVLMYFQLNNPSLITNDFLNNTYKSIVENTTLFDSKSDFQILCAVRAYDLIIELKVSPEGSEINLLKEFNSSFLKRIKILSWFIQTVLLVALLYATIELISFKPTVKEFFDKIGSVLKIFGLFGISQLGNIFPIIKRKSYETLLRILGYPKALVKEVHKKEGN